MSELPNHNNFQVNIRNHEKFEQLFKALDARQSYCMYWFECSDIEAAHKLISILDKKRNQLFNGAEDSSVWKVPPSNGNSDSKVIYVGVRQGGVRKRDNSSNLSGRTCQHLGYYKNGATGALYFIQWALGENVNMTLNVMEIGHPAEKQYLYILEKLAAIALRPLCGKH